MTLSSALRLVVLLVGLPFAAAPAPASGAEDWEAVVDAAEGQTVYWNAWGGDARINAYIAWVADEVAARYGIELRHVKLADTAEAVARVLAEKSAGEDEAGSVDLIWLNGENFAQMKRNGLLYGPFAERLPNFALVDTDDKPTTLVDFTVPTDGLESPWGMAKLNFIYDSARLAEPPRSIPGFLDWARAHPGRFTYPAPPDFIGSTFLKQALIELTPDADILQRPVVDEARFEAATAPLWAFLDALHPNLWRGGRGFPASGPAQRRLLDDGEVDIAISFYPNEASALIDSGQLPASARLFVLDNGTIANTHFLAIPYNATAKAAAMVVANFLLSPRAQAKKQDVRVWGDDTVLDLDRLTPAERALFAALPRGPATLAPQALGPSLLEPHPSWMTRIETAWQARYSR